MQDFLAISIVAIAAGYLARQGWLRFVRKSSGACGACSNCGSEQTANSLPIVTLSNTSAHAKAPRR